MNEFIESLFITPLQLGHATIGWYLIFVPLLLFYFVVGIILIIRAKLPLPNIVGIALFFFVTAALTNWGGAAMLSLTVEIILDIFALHDDNTFLVLYYIPAICFYVYVFKIAKREIEEKKRD